MLNSHRPIAKKAVLSERPLSAKYINPHRFLKNSFQYFPNNPITFDHTNYDQCLQDIGTSMSPLKYDLIDSAQLPIKNLTFDFTAPNNRNRRKRVLIVKRLHTNSDTPKSRGTFNKSNRSMMKFCNYAKQDDTRRQKFLRNTCDNIRPSTCRSSGPITKRVLSEYDIEQSNGLRLFDISEVLSVAHGCINLKNLKVSK